MNTMEEGKGALITQPQEDGDEDEQEEDKGRNNQQQQQLFLQSCQKNKQFSQEIWSWGAGTDGQLGTAKLEDLQTPQLLINLFSPSPSPSPSILSSFPPISYLSCGGAHVLALTSCGKVMSWGRGGSGQLGHGVTVPNSLYPKLVDSLATFNISHVSAGWNHSGFVSDCGCLFTCGDGSYGQLGHGDYQSCNLPKKVSFFSSKTVEQIACGMRHSLVLIKGDELYGFGSGKRYQLGVSKDKIRSLNLPQQCLGFEGSEVVSIVANGDHSAALSGDGRLFTWGRGFGSSSDVPTPLCLPSSLSFKQASLGWNHALVLTSEGEVFMLGGSYHGVLSEPLKKLNVHNSSDSGEPSLSKVPGLDGKRAVQVAAGAEHSAIVTENGQIWTWGWGEHGQLGLGNTSDQIFPQLVDLGQNPNNNNGTPRVYCGSGFTFAFRTQSTPSY